jgi:uncharacterized protein (DUF697 family)
MDLFDVATMLDFNGKWAESVKNFEAAWQLERQAALLAREQDIGEPSVSVLFRSAASIALKAGKLDEARELADLGKSEATPPEIAAELQEIVDQVDGIDRSTENEIIGLTGERKEKCEKIIRDAAAAAAARTFGLGQFPGSGNTLLTPIEVGMILSLGRVFGINLTQAAAMALVAEHFRNIRGKRMMQVLFGWVPFIGNALNAGTAAGLIEIFGWEIVMKFLTEKEKDSR